MDKFTIISIAALVAVAVIVTLLVRFRRKPRKINVERFQQNWKNLQKFLASKDTWSDAVIDADKLLDEALRKLRFKGKTTGERMMSARKQFTDNDGVWFGHKLSRKIEHGEVTKVSEKDVKDALLGIGQALRDLGVLKR